MTSIAFDIPKYKRVFVRCPVCSIPIHEKIEEGKNNVIYNCDSCKASIFKGIKDENKKCEHCGKDSLKYLKTLKETDGITILSHCPTCRVRTQMMLDSFEKGGIYWKCKSCGKDGTLSYEHPISVKVRQDLKRPAPMPCGVTFDKKSCPVCGKENFEKEQSEGGTNEKETSEKS